MDKPSTELVAIIVGIFGLLQVITNIFLPWVLQKYKAKEIDLIDQVINYDDKIDNQLSELKEALKADRISIYQFHNGEKFYKSSMHIKKISKSFESISPGIAHDILNMQSLPIQIFTHMIKLLYNNNVFLCYNIDSITDDTFKEFVREKGIKSLYAYAIRGLNKEEMIGILTISYIKNNVELSENNLVKAKLLAEKLTGFICK